MSIRRFQFGEFEIFGLSDGSFYLDGGAMFGVVPKILWQKKCPADSKNRIKLGLNCFLIKTPKSLVLLETGLGSKLSGKFNDIFKVERRPDLLSTLGEAGFDPADVDFVVNTHLHFDHCGGNTRLTDQGDIVPTFPRARYVIQKGEWEAALNPEERDRPSYLQENFVPLGEHRAVELIDGDLELTRGVEAIVVPGHTARHQCLKISSGGSVLFFLGDLVPMSAHVNVPYVMSFDLYPLETMKNKRKYYELGLNEGWLFGFDHDPDHQFGRLRKAKDRYEFEPDAGPLSDKPD
jgi:glyoxylase-like metal-dependent hydrolase (beta-lactamase superfamily II)